MKLKQLIDILEDNTPCVIYVNNGLMYIGISSEAKLCINIDLDSLVVFAELEYLAAFDDTVLHIETEMM